MSLEWRFFEVVLIFGENVHSAERFFSCSALYFARRFFWKLISCSGLLLGDLGSDAFFVVLLLLLLFLSSGGGGDGASAADSTFVVSGTDNPAGRGGRRRMDAPTMDLADDCFFVKHIGCECLRCSALSNASRSNIRCCLSTPCLCSLSVVLLASSLLTFFFASPLDFFLS